MTLDSVIGRASDRRALLTITFPKYGIQFGRIIEKSRPGDVVRALEGVFRRLPLELAMESLQVLLCDNGTEFSRLPDVEEDEGGERVRSVFRTTPYKPTDKAECERLHGLARYCLPKGRSLDRLDQQQVDAMFSNINSYVRGEQGRPDPLRPRRAEVRQGLPGRHRDPPGP